MKITMTHIVSSIVLIVVLFYIGDTKISFSPFRVHVERPYLIVACLLFTLAVTAWSYDFYTDGYKMGHHKAIKNALEVMEKKSIDMQDKELLNEALDFIVKREQDNDYICDVLNDISEETDICAEKCQYLNKSCVLRLLRRRIKGEIKW